MSEVGMVVVVELDVVVVVLVMVVAAVTSMVALPELAELFASPA